MKTVLKIIKKSYLFIIIILLYFVYLSITKIYIPKNDFGYSQITSYYKQPKKLIDVLFIGSSQIFTEIDNGILFDDYGITSFNLASGNQNVCTSYYYLKEALNYQKPKLVFVDLYSLFLNDNANSFLDDIFAGISGLKNSLLKFEFVFDSIIPTKYKIMYFFGLPVFHERKDLTYRDFTINNGYKYWENTKGYVPFKENLVLTEKKYTKHNISGKITDYKLSYFSKIVELCNDNNIQLIFFKTPIYDPDSQGFRLSYNSLVKYINREFNNSNVLFIDTNEKIKDIGLDYKTDFNDEVHLNFLGANKYTKYIGKLIKKNFNIEDRRNEKDVESYKIITKYNKTLNNDYRLALEKDFNNYIKLLDNENYYIIMSIYGDINQKQYNYLLTTLKGIEIEYDGINKIDFIENNKISLDKIYIIDNKKCIEYNNKINGHFYKEFDRFKVVSFANTNNKFKAPLIKSFGYDYKLSDKGISFHVINKYLESYAHDITFNFIDDSINLINIKSILDMNNG